MASVFHIHKISTCSVDNFEDCIDNENCASCHRSTFSQDEKEITTKEYRWEQRQTLVLVDLTLCNPQFFFTLFAAEVDPGKRIFRERTLFSFPEHRVGQVS